MADITTKISIIDKNTLELQVDAKKGDIIMITDLSTVDISSISEKIIRQTDKIYTQKLNEQKEVLEESFKKELVDKEKIYESDAKLKYETKIQKLEADLRLISDAKQKDEQIITNEITSKFQQRINELEKQIQILTATKDADKQLLESKLKNEFNQEKHDLSNKIVNLQANIDQIKREKSTANIKQIGENLETWCKEEFDTYALSGFTNCTFIKDNQVSKTEGEAHGTKGDFIFKVYANDEFNIENEITSVCLEMKSESLTSVNKKKNEDHYKKLHEDRTKKNAEYALLVSELEMDTPNDSPIKKVQRYDKMYVVRPQYFIIFLSMIETLSKKYQNIILETNKEAIEFKEKNEIIDSFEKAKEEIINGCINNIGTQLDVIDKQAQAIQSALSKLTEALRKIKETHLRTVVNKIENINIKKITNKIEKL